MGKEIYDDVKLRDQKLSYDLVSVKLVIRDVHFYRGFFHIIMLFLLSDDFQYHLTNVRDYG